MLQRQQPMEVYKLAALRPCQSTCVTHGLTKQEHAGTGGRAVIPPFLMGFSRRIQAAVFSFIAGVMPPMPMLGRSLL
ncbi:hypothetical protein SAMN04488523_13113 [Sulfitobacter brevis]|uniref:Uncharacterized protein n=1 Tax=Sulfitobacter brevis TaxID=74348 RepID=A0A1I2GYD5_9RHOB|nr:hypothetical protein SAMN04488523_13113 [Sulfitobacter brevis]